MEELFSLEEAYLTDPFASSRFNVAPSQEIPIVLAGKVRLATWGFTSASRAGLLINARSESAWTKPTWAQAVRQAPCVFLMSGYYEWSSDSGRKQPFYIHPAGQDLMLAAGCVQRGPSGGLEAAVLTRTPRPEIAHLHDRMPLLMDRDGAQAWLFERDLNKREHLLSWEFQETLAFHPVDPQMGSVRIDGPQNILPYKVPEPAQASLF